MNELTIEICKECIHFHSLGGGSFACKKWDHSEVGENVQGRSLMEECQEHNHQYFATHIQEYGNATVNPEIAFRHLRLKEKNVSPINLLTDLFQPPYANTSPSEPTEPRYTRRLRSSSGRIRFTQELVDDMRADPAFTESVRSHFTDEENRLLDSLLDDAIRDSE